MSSKRQVQAQPVGDASYDLSSRPIVDASIDSGSKFEYTAIHTTIENLTALNNPGARYEFYAPETKKLYHIDQSYIEVECYVTVGGAAMIADNEVAFSNGVQSLFTDCHLRINNTDVERVQNANVVGNVFKLAYQSKDQAKSVATSEAWSLDTTRAADMHPLILTQPAGHVTLPDPVAPGDTPLVLDTGMNVVMNSAFNKGFAKRQQLLVGSTEGNLVHLRYKPPLGFFNDQNKVIWGAKLELFLTRNSDACIIHKAGGVADVAVIIRRLTWWVPYSQPRLELFSQIQQHFNEGNSTAYQFTSTNCARLTVPQDTARWAEGRVGPLQGRPTKVFIAILPSRAETNQETSSSIFEARGLRDLRLFVNNVPYPEIQYTNMGSSDLGFGFIGNTGFGAGKLNYVRLLEDLYRESGANCSALGGNQITLDNYARLFPIFLFNTKNTDNDAPFPNDEPTDLRIELDRIATDAACPADLRAWSVFVISVFDCVMEYHDRGVVTMQYAAI